MQVKYIKLILTIFLIGLLTGPVMAADSLTIPDLTLYNNQVEDISIRLVAANGLSGYNITFTIDDGDVAKVSAVTFPTWAQVHSSSATPTATMTAMGADLANSVTAPANTVIITLSIHGLSIGTANLTATINQLDDDSGNTITPSITNATITVSDDHITRPTASATPIPTIDQSPYDNLLGIFGGDESHPENTTDVYLPDVESGLGTIMGVYTDVMGTIALVIVFATPFVMMWIIGGSVTLPAVVGIVEGGFILYRLPESYHMIALAFIALAIVAIIYSLYKEH